MNIIRAEVRPDADGRGRPVLVMAHEDVNWTDDSVCHVPSCRYRGLDHSGRCAAISQGGEIGPDRGERV